MNMKWYLDDCYNITCKKLVKNKEDKLIAEFTAYIKSTDEFVNTNVKERDTNAFELTNSKNNKEVILSKEEAFELLVYALNREIIQWLEASRYIYDTNEIIECVSYAASKLNFVSKTFKRKLIL